MRGWGLVMGGSAFQESNRAVEAEAAERADRLEAMGRKTGGVAHDFNNLLTVIIGITDHLAHTLEDGSEQQQLARDGLKAAKRGAELTRRLMADSRRAGRLPETLEANDIVDEVADLMRHALPARIQFMPVETTRPLYCVADRVDLLSALMNFCANARDAMPDGGRLSLAAECAMLSDRAAGALGLEGGRYVIFEVCDTGCGMPAEVLKRATERFFTTKGPEGTGLGLAEAAEFARDSGGTLAICSREGEGTCVSLYLPGAGPAPKLCRLEAGA